MIKKWMIGVVTLILLLNLTGCENEKLNTIKNSNAADEQGSVTINNKSSAVSETISTGNEITFNDSESVTTAGEAVSTESEAPSAGSEIASSGVDVDLTQLSSTMVYSEVYNMFVSPDDYIGKTIKMKGAFSIFRDEETDKVYYTCIIADATACCSQGLEFVWKGEHDYPEDYPELESEITVTGVFQTYEEDGSLYCNLIDAELEGIWH